MLKFSPCHELQKDKADHASYVIDPTTNAPSPTGEVDYLILNGEVDVSYTEILFAYLNTSYGRIDLAGTTLLKKGAVFASGEIRQIASVEKRQFGSAEIRQFESIEKSQS